MTCYMGHTRHSNLSRRIRRQGVEVEGWGVVANPLMLLGKAGIQELEGTVWDGAEIDEVELTETQSSKAGPPELEVAKMQQVLNSTTVAAPPNPLRG